MGCHIQKEVAHEHLRSLLLRNEGLGAEVATRDLVGDWDSAVSLAAAAVIVEEENFVEY